MASHLAFGRAVLYTRGFLFAAFAGGRPLAADQLRQAPVR
jgi:hypothetical protein